MQSQIIYHGYIEYPDIYIFDSIYQNGEYEELEEDLFKEHEREFYVSSIEILNIAVRRLLTTDTKLIIIITPSHIWEIDSDIKVIDEDVLCQIENFVLQFQNNISRENLKILRKELSPYLGIDYDILHSDNEEIQIPISSLELKHESDIQKMPEIKFEEDEDSKYLEPKSETIQKIPFGSWKNHKYVLFKNEKYFHNFEFNTVADHFLRLQDPSLLYTEFNIDLLNETSKNLTFVINIGKIIVKQDEKSVYKNLDLEQYFGLVTITDTEFDFVLPNSIKDEINKILTVTGIPFTILSRGLTEKASNPKFSQNESELTRYIVVEQLNRGRKFSRIYKVTNHFVTFTRFKHFHIDMRMGYQEFKDVFDEFGMVRNNKEYKYNQIIFKTSIFIIALTPVDDKDNYQVDVIIEKYEPKNFMNIVNTIFNIFKKV